MPVRRFLPHPASLGAGALMLLGAHCSSPSGGGASSPSVDAGLGVVTWKHPQGTVSVQLTPTPFSLKVLDASGNVLLESVKPQAAADAGAEAGGAGGDAGSSPLSAYAPLSFTHNTDESTAFIMKGWDYYRGADGPWQQATHATTIESDKTALVAHLATTDPAHTMTVRIEPNGPGVRIAGSMDDPGTDPTTAINRVSFGWKMHDDTASMPGDHFLGLG